MTVRVADFPDRIPLVLPTLADFECAHGNLGNCSRCRTEWVCMCGSSTPLRESRCGACGDDKPTEDTTDGNY